MSLGPKENTAIESMNQWGGGGGITMVKNIYQK